MYLPTYFLWPEKVSKPTIWDGFFCFKFPINPLRFTSHQRICTKKNLSNFARLQLLNHKIDQKNQFCQMASFVSVSLVRDKSERIESKFK